MQELDVEIFRAGNYGPKGQWDAERLDQVAAGYDPALHEAPVTVDHARGGPALGWVGSVRRVGDRLVARLRNLNERLVEMIRSGAFKKRSVELYPAFRETGGPYLKAVSFLGAAVPEVKGLADPLALGSGPRFDAEADGVLCFEDAIEPPAESAGSEPADGWCDFESLAGRLRRDGRWRPEWGRRGIEAFYRALATVDEVALGEDETLKPSEWFAGFLESLPPVVKMGEAAPAGGEPQGGLTGGGSVDPASLRWHRSALEFMEAHPGTDYGDALRRCAASR